MWVGWTHLVPGRACLELLLLVSQATAVIQGVQLGTERPGGGTRSGDPHRRDADPSGWKWPEEIRHPRDALLKMPGGGGQSNVALLLPHPRHRRTSTTGEHHGRLLLGSLRPGHPRRLTRRARGYRHSGEKQPAVTGSNLLKAACCRPPAGRVYTTFCALSKRGSRKVAARRAARD